MKHDKAFPIYRRANLIIPFLLAGPTACATTDVRVDGLGSATPDQTSTYSEHLHVLASEYFEGRLPGTVGIERAASYIQWHFERLGLEPAFGATETEINGQLVITEASSYRQPFTIGNQTKLKRQALSITINGKVNVLQGGEDFNALAYGGSGKTELPVTFVGYSIPMGPEQYEGYPVNTDLSGRAAMVLRYEPMDEKGGSAWIDEGWSYAATLGAKFRAAENRGAEAILLVTPPGVDSGSAGKLESVETTGRGQPVDIPVFHITPEVADTLIKAGDTDGRSLDDLISMVNEAGEIVPLGAVSVAIDTQIVREPVITDNIGAILPGRGDLAGEFIVIGAHYDHLGMASFGTRFPGEMHLGADDNASGSAGLLTAAKTLVEIWDEIEGPVRSVLFLSFSAEESGLRGSQYYVEHPIRPIETHTLMLNMDMIGSLGNHLETGGIGSAQGLNELIKPVFERSGINVKSGLTVGAGRSDHASFDRRGVPNLFFFTGITDQYHTPDDTIDTINFVGGAKIANLAADLTIAAAVHEGTLEFVKTEEEQQGRRRMGGPSNVKVRIGIAPGDYSGRTGGVSIARVFAGTSAADAGLREGDRIIVWNGERVAKIQDWMPMLSSHEPGDMIDVIIVRDGKELTLPMTLKGR